jgi:hypothetical protein
LLFIPFLFLVSIWAVCAPALIAENVSILDAFGRSRTLTKGVRLLVFLALLLFAVVYVAITFGLQGFSLTGGLALFQAHFEIAVVLGFVSSTLMSLFLTGFLVSLYKETRLVTEGVGPRGLADVFA